MTPSRPSFAGEVAGALGDLGTLLPILLAGGDLALLRRLFEARAECHRGDRHLRP